MTKSFERGSKFGRVYDEVTKAAPAREVARHHALLPSSFAQFAANSHPVIYKLETGSFHESPLPELKSHHGDLLVKVRHGDYSNPENYAPSKRQLKEMSLSEYLTLVSHGVGETPPYAGNFTLPREFLRSIGASPPAFYPAAVFEPPTVWLGAKGCVTPLHRDSTDNFAIHLLGAKRWTIFPPHDAPFLYMTAVAASKGGDFATSAIDLRRPDLATYPLFKNAKALTFEVLAGEVLYLPMGWAHYVENLTTSLMVNYWLSVDPIGIAALRR